MKKIKRQSNYTSSDVWARLIGRANSAPIYLEGHQVTDLLDTGSQLSMISRYFCEQYNLEIQPLSKLVEFGAVKGIQIKYQSYVELVTVPGKWSFVLGRSHCGKIFPIMFKVLSKKK